MDSELVSIVCLCHNQAPFVMDAIESVVNQTHPNIELIIVDDGSTDGSKSVIQNFIDIHKDVSFIDIPASIGNCAAFNRGWRASSGNYLIDLAADDILLENRVEEGVKRLMETNAGVHFSDAWLMDEGGNVLKRHNERFTHSIPEGDIYATLVAGYLICPPTMMFTREVIEYLDGYDETLAYEDFDFWIRSSRQFQYAFTDEPLVRKRIVKNSHAQAQNKFWNSHQRSTLKVCQKIADLNRTEREKKALKKRCWHEIRQCIKKGNLILISDYLSILKQC